MISFAVAIVISSARADIVQIKKIQQSTSFAGKLGQRVSETLVVSSGSKDLIVHITGTYHTKCTHRSQRLKVGDRLELFSSERKGEIILSRDQIRLVR